MDGWMGNPQNIHPWSSMFLSVACCRLCLCLCPLAHCLVSELLPHVALHSSIAICIQISAPGRFKQQQHQALESFEKGKERKGEERKERSANSITTGASTAARMTTVVSVGRWKFSGGHNFYCYTYGVCLQVPFYPLEYQIHTLSFSLRHVLTLESKVSSNRQAEIESIGWVVRSHGFLWWCGHVTWA
jgi:hypothetical protein